MANTLKKNTGITVSPEQAARAAIPYRPAQAAYTSTEVRRVCRLVTRTEGGTSPSLTKVVTIEGGKAKVTYVQIPGTPGVLTTVRVCEDVATTVFHPALPEQKAQAAISYRPRTVVQDFGLRWNAGARSIAELDGNGAATFRVPTAVGAVVGFNDVDEDAGYLNIEHGLYFRRQTFQVMEQGVAKTPDSVFSGSDTFKIERIGGRVRYFRNDGLVYTSTAPSTGRVFLDASLYSGGDTIESPALIATAGGFSSASLLALDGFASETEWNYSRGVLPPLAGSASALRSRSHAAMLPLTGLATQGRYGESRAAMRPLSGSVTGGLLTPAYGLSAAQMMPLYGHAHGPEARYGMSNAVMLPMTGMATDKKYGSSNSTMAPLQGFAAAQPHPMIGIPGGFISHAATVVLATGPMTGLLSGGVAYAAASMLPTQPMAGMLGGGFAPYAEFTLGTVALRGLLGGGIEPLADVVLPSAPFVGLLGGYVGIPPGVLVGLNEVFVLNITGDPAGTTQYKNYAFNSAARIGDRYFGASAHGLFLLDGDDDAGQAIEASFGLGQLDFGSPQIKTVTYCYLGTAAGAMRMRVDALVDGKPATCNYSARGHGRSMREVRFDLGRGLRSSYVMPTFYNCGGASFQVDALRFLTAESARRI